MKKSNEGLIFFKKYVLKLHFTFFFCFVFSDILKERFLLFFTFISNFFFSSLRFQFSEVNKIFLYARKTENLNIAHLAVENLITDHNFLITSNLFNRCLHTCSFVLIELLISWIINKNLNEN